MEPVLLVIMGWVIGVAMTVVFGSIAKGCNDAPATMPIDEDTIGQMRNMNEKGYLKSDGTTYAVNEDGEWDWLGDPDGWKHR